MRIALLKGRSQYGVLRHFTDEMASGLRELGAQADIFDFHDIGTTYPPFHTALAAHSYDLLFSFNGHLVQIGEEVRPPEPDLFNRAGIPFFTHCFDHPASLLGRLEAQIENLTVLCSDRSQVKFVDEIVGRHRRATHLPAAGSRGSQRGLAPLPPSQRPIPILFIGTNRGPASRDFSMIGSGDIRALLNESIDLAMAHDHLSPMDALDATLRRHSIELAAEQRALLFRVVLFANEFVYTERRWRAIHQLGRDEIQVTLVGGDWDQFSTQYKSFTALPTLPYSELQSAMQQAKIVLNISSNYVDGMNERVPDAMIAGAVAVTDFNPFIADTFSIGDELLTYRWTDLASLSQVIRGTLANPDLMDRVAAAGRDKALAEHTWKSRAQSLLAIATAQGIGRDDAGTL
ncbi:glycosyltransferase [Roseiterribacter gracilis]|uniref:Spore protein YkvP/CgeB glycosyl transferase-like domain-containing protein n=1 Tax=Roseiterribacter gracilis TaxID=2812848 RepID=A0A8S8XL06_9PROT|nr:hypothetical protein TMPK1_37270 [Rhodospirillales bacterium TMPK1]